MLFRSKGYALAMTSVADTNEGFDRLCRALEDVEKEWRKAGRRPGKASAYLQEDLIYGEPVIPLSRAAEMEKTKVPFFESAGRLAGDFVYLYPPGIPLAAPGERITPAFLEAVQGFWAAGLSVQGIFPGPERSVAVLKCAPEEC